MIEVARHPTGTACGSYIGDFSPSTSWSTRQIGSKGLISTPSTKVCCNIQTHNISLPNIYIDEKGLPEETVAFLFLIGFVSAGIAASFTGTFADRHGRRTSLTLLTDNIYVLFFGRVLGGISGTLLWSVFESWLVAEFNKLMLEEADTALSAIFSMMTTSNTCVAIVAGLIAEWLVRITGTAKAPFLLSAGCLSLAFLAISKYWVSWRFHLAFWGMANMTRARTMVLAIEPRPRVVHFCKKKRPKRSFHQRPP
jgi:MFS family permease